GGDGAPGRVIIMRSNGEVISLPSKATIDLEPGDEVIVETPGGGGYGSKR
ncbi:MAG: hydantoinase B/oxoprolinase family protein, partial [Vulcanisaeta sp.]